MSTIPQTVRSFLLSQPTDIYLKCIQGQRDALKDFNLKIITSDIAADIFNDIEISTNKEITREELIGFRESLLTLKRPLPFLSDLYKLCYLYEKGGFVVDLDLFFFKNIPAELRDNEITLIDYPNANHIMITECLVGSIPKHPLLLKKLKLFLKSKPIEGYISPSLNTLKIYDKVQSFSGDYVFNHMRFEPVSYELKEKQIAMHLWGEKKYDFQILNKLVSKFEQKD